MSNFIDFHIHIDYYKDYYKIYEWLDSKKIYTLFVTNFPEIYEKCLKNFKTSKYIKIALGYNPQIIEQQKFNKKIFDKYLFSTKYVGEVGLDFSRKYITYKKYQMEVFEYICKKAAKTNKILSVHSRNAEKEILDILKKNKVKFVVFHWYTGEIDFVDEIINEGYYFSINPSMLKSKKGRDIINKIPKNKILVESDGPFGKINNKTVNPQDIIKVYDLLSLSIGIDSKKFQSLVYNNLKTLLIENLKQ